MDNIRKRKKTLLIVSVLLSIGLPAGVLCIIFGATKSIVFLLVAGIILTVAGFYVMPIMWVKFGEARTYELLCMTVMRDGLRKIKDIAAQMGITEERAAALIKTSLFNRYLEGFMFSEDGTALIEIEAPENPDATIYIKCQSCGASATVKKSDPRCPYCGSVNMKN